MRTPTAAELEAIGQTIQTAREEQRRTQEDVAGAIGVHQSIVSRIEGGKYKRPNVVILMSLSQEVGCNPLALIAPFFNDGPEIEPELVAS